MIKKHANHNEVMEVYTPDLLQTFRIKIIITILTMLALASARAQSTEQLAEIDKIFSWATPATPGCVCAVSQNGKVVVNRAYGSADLERNIPLTTNSVFDAGSLVKQFVAAATLILVEEGKLSLSDDVRKHIPELPDYGHKITIDHLLTHTSGLRDWTGLLMLANKDVDALTIILRQRGLNFVPGEEWAYSNSGYVLLKEIVARTSGMSFAKFTHKRLFEPLGMQFTTYQNDLRQVIINRSLAYEKERDEWKLEMLLDNDRGGGGALFSTAGDLLIWNEALTNNRLGAYVTQKLQEPAVLSNGRELGYARGLFLDETPGRKIIWHSGSAGAYKSLMARFPLQGLSIAIMCNGGDSADRMMYGRRIFDLFVPGMRDAETEPEPTPVKSGANVSESDLKSRAGLFFSEHGDPMRLVVEDGWLRVARGPRLIAEAKDRFKRSGAALEFMSQDAFELNFISQDMFELKSMEGKITRYRRAVPYTPAPEDLKVFEGRYQSTEMGSVFQIVAGNDKLVMRFELTPDKKVELRPVAPDTFQIGMMTVRFLRDKAGKVVAFDYSNPLLRHIKYTRLDN